MNLIKNFRLLKGFSNEDLEMMEHAAVVHQRYNNITFKIIEINDKKVIIQAVQGKNAAEKYFEQKRLVEIVHETFDRFFKGRTMNVHAVPFVESPANKVTAEWIRNKMTETGTKLKDMAVDTGVDYSYLSSLTNGSDPLSQPIKALFYYYFKLKTSSSSSN
jgi:hypothetical protein